MSTRSFEPAARIFGRVGSTAREGSFEAFRGCCPCGLPIETNASVAWLAGGFAMEGDENCPMTSTSNAAADAPLARSLLMTRLLRSREQRAISGVVSGLHRGIHLSTDHHGGLQNLHFTHQGKRVAVDRAQRQGYADGVASPQGVSINGTLASEAVRALIMLMAGDSR